MTAPAWATSVNAFSSAVNNSAAVTTAQQVQFPDTSQLGGLCGGLLGGHALTNGLVNSGNLNGGTAGALVSGTQGFTDGLCGLMGGPGVATTPQSILAGGSNVAGAVNNNPMASGTVAMGGSSGNTALDAINGGQIFANNLYSTIAPCGCGGGYSPPNVTPDQVTGAAAETSAAVQANPMAMGILAQGGSGGNVALNAINGTMGFANSLFSIISGCGCGGGYNPQTATPASVLAAAHGTANAVTGTTVGTAALALGGSTGNVATDMINGADIWFTGVSATAGAAHGVATAARDSAQQAGTAAANVAAAVSAAQSQAIANDAIGGDFTTIVPVGSAGTALPAGSWSATGPSTGNVDIEGNYGFAGIPPSLPAGTYWAMPAFTYQTDSQYIAVVLGDEGGVANAYTTLYFHCNAGFTSGAYLALSFTGFTLGTFTYAAGTFTYTPLSGGGVSMLLISGQTVAVQNIGTAFTVLVNSQPILHYTTGTIVQGAGFRHGAVSMSRVLA